MDSTNQNQLALISQVQSLAFFMVYSKNVLVKVKEVRIKPASDYQYLYNTNSVCVCVCLLRIGGQTAGPIMTKFGTYMRIDLGMVPT